MRQKRYKSRQGVYVVVGVIKKGTKITAFGSVFVVGTGCSLFSLLAQRKNRTGKKKEQVLDYLLSPHKLLQAGVELICPMTFHSSIHFPYFHFSCAFTVKASKPGKACFGVAENKGTTPRALLSGRAPGGMFPRNQ